jgi:membrane protein implicated in regulation of membrane protease activity
MTWTWADFYLICFVVGFVLSLASVMAGGSRWHLPHFPHAHGGGLHLHVGHGAGMAGHGSLTGSPGAKGLAQGSGGQLSPFNFVTFTAFLAWFGGTGYLLSRYSTMWFVLGLVTAVVSGLGAAAVVYFFLGHVFMSEDENLDPADFEMTGVLGRISSSIREGGTGEIIYSQADTRRVCGARAEDSCAIPKGTEVVVTRYEKGIAYVSLWSEMAGEGTDSSNDREASKSGDSGKS